MAEGKFKPVESIVVGDRVMGDDGTPRNVTGVTQGREGMVRIVSKKGTKIFGEVEKKRLNDECELARRTGGAVEVDKMPALPTLDREPAFVCNLSHVLSIKLSGNPSVSKAGVDHARALSYCLRVAVASRDDVGVATRLVERNVYLRTSVEASLLAAALGRAVDARQFGLSPEARQRAIDAAVSDVVRALGEDVRSRKKRKQTSDETTSNKKTASTSATVAGVDDDGSGNDASDDDEAVGNDDDDAVDVAVGNNDDDDNDNDNDDNGVNDDDVSERVVLSDDARRSLIAALGTRLRLAPSDAVLSFDETVDIAVKDFIDPRKTSAPLRRVAMMYHAPVMQFPVRDEQLPIDPWLLGNWLGDGSGGTSEQGTVVSVNITTADQEVVAAAAPLDGVNPYTKPANKATTWKFVVGHRHQDENMFLNYINEKKLGYTGKHIPDEYKYGTVATRLAVLAGLLDADGYTVLSGMELCLKSDKLFEDAVFVARSLGYQVCVCACVCVCVCVCVYFCI